MTYPSQKITMHEAIFFVMHDGKWFTTWDFQDAVISRFNIMLQEKLNLVILKKCLELTLILISLQWFYHLKFLISTKMGLLEI